MMIQQKMTNCQYNLSYGKFILAYVKVMSGIFPMRNPSLGELKGIYKKWSPLSFSKLLGKTDKQ
jgi:hypothetical protein